MTFLAEPHIDLQDAFLKMYQTYQDLAEVEWCASYADALADFPRFIRRLQDDSKGVGIPSDWVPTSHFWLVHEDRLGGTFRLRHWLTPVVAERAGHIGYDIAPPLRGRGLGHEILRLGLMEARKLGIHQVMAICSETNVPSRKVLIRQARMEGIRENGEVVYWLTTEMLRSVTLQPQT